MVTATKTPGTPVANGVAKPKQKLSKNQLRRAKKKQQKQSSRESSVVSTSASESESESVWCKFPVFGMSLTFVRRQETEKPAPVPLITPDDIPQFESDDLEIDENDPNFAEYRRILDKFRADNVRR
jgi:splicing factor 3B subunit 2